ncbi:hypothetical protein [Actinoplanes sp. NPDC049265]|uniref:hypothetical protein n=1 Tax=Actinoplanes sp. NPDC049265 TaxID=3363902 RepID=UPI00371C38AC
MSGKKIVVAALSAGIAVAALTGCTPGATRPGAAAPISSSTAPTPATSSEPSSPAAPAHSAAPRPTKTRTTEPAGQGGSGGSGSTGWSGVDFNKVLFRALGCVDNAEAKGKVALYSVDRVDLAGDTAPEAVVAGSCTPLTGPDHAYVLVFDGAKPGNHPRTMLKIGDGQTLTSADVRINGRNMQIISRALTEKAPLCCPDLLITQTWVGHRGGGITRTSLTTQHLKD